MWQIKIISINKATIAIFIIYEDQNGS